MRLATVLFIGVRLFPVQYFTILIFFNVCAVSTNTSIIYLMSWMSYTQFQNVTLGQLEGFENYMNVGYMYVGLRISRCHRVR